MQQGQLNKDFKSLKPVEVPIYTKKHPFLSKYLNSISWIKSLLRREKD